MAPVSARNPKLQRLRRLARRARDRAQERAFVLEGEHLIRDALTAGAELEAVFAEPGAPEDLLSEAQTAGVPVVEVADAGLAAVVSTRTPQPVAAIAPWCDRPVGDIVRAACERALPVLVLVDVSDPGNAGTLVRAAEAAGAAGVVFGGDSVDPFSPKCVRATSGSLFHLPLARAVDAAPMLAELGAAGLRRVATSVDAPVSIYDAELGGAIALIVGSEARGLTSEVEAAVDEWVTITMAGRSESLNVAMAGAVVCFEALRQRTVASS